MDYSKTKIYKICSHIGDKIYIGSTTKDYLSQRMSAHRNRYGEWKNEKYHFITSFLIFDEYGIDNCFIELLEAKVCANKDEKNKLEGSYIRSNNCVNKNLPDPNKKERQKAYNEAHKDIIKERASKKITCDCGMNIAHIGFARHLKSKRHNNLLTPNYAEIKLQKSDEQKQKAKEKKKARAVCECGTEICKNDKWRHIQSPKHIYLMQNINALY